MTEMVQISKKKISRCGYNQLEHYKIDYGLESGEALDRITRALGNANVRKAIDLYHADIEFDINTNKRGN